MTVGFPRRAGARAGCWSAPAVLIAVTAAQGLIGLVQFATGVPEALVVAHVLGAVLLTAAAANVVLATRTRASARVGCGGIVGGRPASGLTHSVVVVRLTARRAIPEAGPVFSGMCRSSTRSSSAPARPVCRRPITFLDSDSAMSYWMPMRRRAVPGNTVGTH